MRVLAPSRPATRRGCPACLLGAVAALLCAHTQADEIRGRAARHILDAWGGSKGYCLDLGAGEGALGRELVSMSGVKVVGIEENVGKVHVGRTALHDAGLYGDRVTLHLGSLDDLPYRDYAAALVVSSAILESGVCTGSASEMFRMVRPEGGMAIIGQPPGAKHPLSESSLRAWLDAAELDYTLTNTEEEGLWAVIRRGPLEGAGEWTHMWADLGNTAWSRDARTRDDFSVLWFGEPGPRVMVDRHWEPVAPLYKRGRFFVPGQDRIICVDAFNGARLWDLVVEHSSRIAMMRDAGYLALAEETLYLVVDSRCLCVDVKTGAIRTAFSLTTLERDWGYVAVDDTWLYGSEQVAGASYLAATTGPGAEGNQLGRGDNRFLVTSTALFCRARRNGAERWRYEPDGRVIANPTICIGDDGVHFFETTEASCVSDEDGRVLMGDFTKDSAESLVKLDRATGNVVWRKQHDMKCRHVFHLSHARGVLVASGCTTIRGHYWYHLRAYRAADGAPLWERDLDTTYADSDTDHGKQDKHPMLIGDTVQLKHGSFDLATGEPLGVSFQTTNCADCSASNNHIFTRNNGLATIINRQEGGAGKPLCSVMRPGCYISIIPAGGIVMLPAFSAGCTCNYTIQTSIAWLPRGEAGS